MIGAVLGGTPSLRYGTAVKHAGLEAVRGRRIVTVSGLPEVPPVLDRFPGLLAPSFRENLPVDLAAECYAMVPGGEEAAELFADYCLSAQGASVNLTSNDRHWNDNLRMGLKSLFRFSGILSREGGIPLSRILLDCAYEIQSLVSSSSGQRYTGKPPQWMERIPQGIRGSFEAVFLRGSSVTVMNHFDTIIPLLTDFERCSPKTWTRPFVSDPGGEPLFIHTPDWSEATLAFLLRVCAAGAGAFFVLPELHRWSSRDTARVGYAFQSLRGTIDGVLTSALLPGHPGFFPDWELYGATSSEDILSFFTGRLAACGGESRLKELPFETPSSLVGNSAILRRPEGWSVTVCGLFDESGLLRPERRGGKDSFRDCFKDNLEAEREMDLNRPPVQEAPRPAAAPCAGEKDGVRIDGIPKRIGDLSISEALYTLGDRRVVLNRNCAVEKDRPHVALLVPGSPEPEHSRILCEKVWSAATLPDFMPAGPQMTTWLHFETTGGTEIDPDPSPGNIVRRVEVHAPFLDKRVTLVVPAGRSLASADGDDGNEILVAVGEWLEPKEVFLVTELLEPVCFYRGPWERPPMWEDRWQHRCLRSGKQRAEKSREFLDALGDGRSFGEMERLEEDLRAARADHETKSRSLVTVFTRTGAYKNLEASGFKGSYRGANLGSLAQWGPFGPLQMIAFCDFSLLEELVPLLDEEPGSERAAVLAELMASRLITLHGMLFASGE